MWLEHWISPTELGRVLPVKRYTTVNYLVSEHKVKTVRVIIPHDPGSLFTWNFCYLWDGELYRCKSWNLFPRRWILYIIRWIVHIILYIIRRIVYVVYYTVNCINCIIRLIVYGEYILYIRTQYILTIYCIHIVYTVNCIRWIVYIVYDTVNCIYYLWDGELYRNKSWDPTDGKRIQCNSYKMVMIIEVIVNMMSGVNRVGKGWDSEWVEIVENNVKIYPTLL